MSQIVWEKSFFMTADEVATLGLDGISVNDKELVEDDE